MLRRNLALRFGRATARIDELAADNAYLPAGAGWQNQWSPPPIDASDFENVPVIRSTSSVSPKCSAVPAPVSPRVSVMCKQSWFGSSSGMTMVSGAQTPLYENYFAGGFSTLRGFRFRGASPRVGSVTVGGEFRMLGATTDEEYERWILGDPALERRARLVGEVDELAELDAYEIGQRTSAFGSGGMRSKVAAAEMASAAGIPVVICDGTAPGTLRAAAGGEPVGTSFKPHPDRTPSFKLWLRYAKPSRGRLLIDAGEHPELQERHAHYFLNLAGRAEPGLASKRQAEWVDRLEPEFPNVQAVLDWALEWGEIELAVRYGRPLPALGEAVQAGIGEALRTSVDLAVDAVDVSIEELER